MKNVMLDLETLGNRSYSAILSIGAVSFDPTGLHETFYSVVSLESCMSLKMQTDASTIMWWFSQSDKARKEFTKSSGVHISEALLSFSEWYKKVQGGPVWGNGATFDNVILSNAYGVCGLKRPWDYRQDRCYRTLRAMYPEIQKEDNNDAHNALSDAVWQAEYLLELKKRHQELRI